MSYILDALRKADAERERGNVPGIHAQPTIGGSAPTATPGTRLPWPWIGAHRQAPLGGVIRVAPRKRPYAAAQSATRITNRLNHRMRAP